MTPAREAKLRAWLEYVVETAIGMLDELDAAGEDREPDNDDEDVRDLEPGPEEVGYA